MGVCVKCKFCKKVESPFMRCDEFSYYCGNPETLKVNFVTGKTEEKSCYDLNYFEECLYFEEIENEEIPPVEDTNNGEIDSDGNIETPKEDIDNDGEEVISDN